MLLLLLHPATAQESSVARQRLEPQVHDDEGQRHDEGRDDPPPVRNGEKKTIGAEEDGTKEGLENGGGGWRKRMSAKQILLRYPL